METSSWGLSVPRSLTLGILSGSGSLFLLPSTAKGRFSDEDWERCWFVNITGCRLESFYCCAPSAGQQYLPPFQAPGLPSPRFQPPRSVRRRLSLTDWALRWLLPQALCHYCSSLSCRQVITGDLRVWSGLVFTFLLCWHAEYFPVPWAPVSRDEVSR